MQQQPSASRIDLGSHHERVTTRPHGWTWPTACAGGPHTIQHAYQALMPPTRKLRAACCEARRLLARVSMGGEPQSRKGSGLVRRLERGDKFELVDPLSTLVLAFQS